MHILRVSLEKHVGVEGRGAFSSSKSSLPLDTHTQAHLIYQNSDNAYVRIKILTPILFYFLAGDRYHFQHEKSAENANKLRKLNHGDKWHASAQERRFESKGVHIGIFDRVGRQRSDADSPQPPGSRLSQNPEQQALEFLPQNNRLSADSQRHCSPQTRVQPKNISRFELKMNVIIATATTLPTFLPVTEPALSALTTLTAKMNDDNNNKSFFNALVHFIAFSNLNFTFILNPDARKN